MKREDSERLAPVASTTAFAFLIDCVRRRPVWFGSLLVLVACAAACAVAAQYGMKLVVDAMAAPDRTGSGIWRSLGWFICAIALESVLWRGAGLVGCRTIVATGVDIRLDLFNRLTGHAMRFFREQMSGSLGGRITATAGAAGALYGNVTWRIAPPIVDFIGAVVVFLTIDGRMAAALVGFVVLVGLVILRIGHAGGPLHRAYAELGARVNGELVDVVSNMWTVKAFSARRREYGRLRQQIGREAGAQRRSWTYLERVRGIHDLCLMVLAGAMLAWAVHQWQGSAITSGDVVVISALTFRILHGSRDLALALVDSAQQYAQVGTMMRIVDGSHAVQDAPGAAPLGSIAGAVEFRRAHFRYPDSGPLLEDFSLRIEPGERIGLVGPSGAGKSTLLALIQRLDDLQSGALTIDDQPIASVTQDSLRAAIAVVPQDIALFHRSVMDNIRYGQPQASDAEVRRAAELARCGEFVDALPQGYDTLVGERGARLSGGQRQRIGIARAFLKDAPILLLDEATSALDSESESEVHAALEQLFRGRTVIAVAHRLATVANFDRIVVLVDGRIVEDGPPDRLIHAGGVYEGLWRRQVRAA